MASIAAHGLNGDQWYQCCQYVVCVTMCTYFPILLCLIVCYITYRMGTYLPLKYPLTRLIVTHGFNGYTWDDTAIYIGHIQPYDTDV